MNKMKLVGVRIVKLVTSQSWRSLLDSEDDSLLSTDARLNLDDEG